MRARMLHGAIDDHIEKLVGIFFGFFLNPVAGFSARFCRIRQSHSALLGGQLG